MAALPKPNANVPQVPHPLADVNSLAVVATALKQGIDSLAGNRGDPKARAVTFYDLISMGLVSNLATDTGGSESFATTDQLGAEAAARQSADTTLLGDIDAETAAREAADSAEAAARIAADNTLQSEIDAAGVGRLPLVSGKRNSDGTPQLISTSNGACIGVRY